MFASSVGSVSGFRNRRRAGQISESNSTEKPGVEAK
jgi:hypothetical protein